MVALGSENTEKFLQTMTLTTEQIRQRFKAPRSNLEFLELWKNQFPNSAQGQSLNILQQQTKRNEFLSEHDGRLGHPSGFSHLHLTRSFQPIATTDDMAEKPALDFALTIDALLPVPLETPGYPWTDLTGWVLYQQADGRAFKKKDIAEAAVRLWLLQQLKIPVFRVVAVYLDEDYRLGASQEISGEFLKTYKRESYDAHDVILQHLRVLEAEIEAASEMAIADYPDATAATRKTVRSYSQMECLKNFLVQSRKDPDQTDQPIVDDPPCEPSDDTTLRIRHLINDREKLCLREPSQSEDTPLADLNPSLAPTLPGGHQLQVAAARSGEIAWSESGRKEMREWLPGESDYPLYFFDLETYSPRLPIWPGTRMNRAVPFQFSLHTRETPDGETSHTEFIHDAPTDPRSHFAWALMDAIPTLNQGRLVIYTHYEVQVLDELLASLEADPGCDQKLTNEYAEWWNHWREKITDLHYPFYQAEGEKNGFDAWLYHPAQMGSTSIKKVVPAFTNKNPYADLAIQDGLTATDQYVEALFGDSGAAADAQVLEDLKAYCKVDTEVMVELFDALVGLSPARP